MKINENRKLRRIWVVTNLAALILSAGTFELIKQANDGNRTLLWVLLGAFLVVFITSFSIAFGVTGIWKFTHSKYAELDEREMMIISNALRISYAVFTVSVILIVYAYALLESGPIDVVIAASMLYLAHILPGSILAWHEKII